MGQSSNEELVWRYLQAHRDHDYDTVGELRHERWTTEWPQSGERVVGHANDRAIMEHWPGGLPTAGEAHVTGAEDRWVMTPSLTFQRITGSGDYWWADATGTYPDGSTWFVAAMLELRDGKLFRERWIFGPSLDAPGWRSEWVERL